MRDRDFETEGTPLGRRGRRICALPTLLAFLLARTIFPAPLIAEEAPSEVVIDEGAEKVKRDPPWFEGIVSGLKDKTMSWDAAWDMPPGASLTPEAQAVVQIAASKTGSRSDFKDEMKKLGKEYKNVQHNLDVGRHDLVKTLLANAVTEANKSLAAQKLQPLERMTTVNSGGTGDYLRDVDITVFAGDPVREEAFFKALQTEAKKLGLDVETNPKLGVKAGINIPGIEVAFHCGQNDLPDPRLATDVKAFALDYRRVIQMQAENPEAYFGYGFEMEVQARRSLTFKPGQTLVQEFTAPGADGKPGYKSQRAACTREVRALLRGAVGQRWRRAQNASHIMCDYMQATQHAKHVPGEKPDPTQGPLKYAGRALERLCRYYGFPKDWSKLEEKDKLALLSHLYPDSDTPARKAQLEVMLKACDTAHATFKDKKVPGDLKGQTQEDASKISLIFLRKACGQTGGSVAAEMLDPPAFNDKLLAAVDPEKWKKMTAEERKQAALKQDETYKACVSIAAMENMLVNMQRLRQLDTQAGPGGVHPGEDAIRHMIESADEKTRPLLQLAADHADAYVRSQDPNVDPKMRREHAWRMAKIRNEMSQGLYKQASPGKELIEKVAKTGPRDYIAARKKSQAPPWRAETESLQSRLKAQVKEMLADSELGAFYEAVKQKGMKSYLKERLMEEAFQLGNISDGLQLIEMYQGDAKAKDYAWFLGTNVLGRCHWSFGFFIQAAQVKDEKALKELGKSILFDALTRLVPGAGQAKIIFDIERGIVTVTVGWAINRLNADLIDAVYTGRAGKPGSPLEGTKAGSIRDAVEPICPEKYIVQTEDEKTKKIAIGIKAGELYKDTVRAWAGFEFDDLGSRAVSGDAGRFIDAHNAVIKAMEREAESRDPTWVEANPKQTAPYSDPKELDRALDEFKAQVVARVTQRVNDVLGANAIREYVVDGKDVIAEGLKERFACDLIAGLCEVWQNRLAEQVLAKREVERMAALADVNAMAKVVHEENVKTRPGDTDYELDVRVVQVPPEEDPDGEHPVRFDCSLKTNGPVPEDLREVFIVPEWGKLKNLSGEGKPKPGDKVKHEVTVHARMNAENGPELAQATVSVELTIPKGKQKIKVQLLTYEDKRRDGSLRERFTYYKSFHSMPKSWKAEDGMVKHGPRETWNYFYEGEHSTENYSYGLLDGKQMIYAKGNLIHEKDFSRGKLNGKWIHYGVGSKARKEIAYVDDYPTGVATFRDDGQESWKLTGQPKDAQTRHIVNGTYSLKSGLGTFSGTFKDVAIDRFVGIEIEGHMTGTWFVTGGFGGHSKGSLADGCKDGRWDNFNEKRKLVGWSIYQKGKHIESHAIKDEEEGK